jgi:iron complex outermembrane receptor protein
MTKRHPWSALLAGALAGAVINVHAQESDPPKEGAAQSEPIQEVLITGSRLRRDSGFDYPVPVAVISGQTISDSGFTVLGDALTNLPQALNTTNIQNTSGTLFNAGQSRVDLRALSSARTLVLVDGRRHLTGDFRTSAVDLNMIPASMIDEIEAISGGASAVYGSEAIAGVVNIKLRKEFRGLELDFLGGSTSESDGEEWKISGIYGTEWADGRGSLMFGGEWGQAKPIYQRDRDWAFPGIRRNTAVNPQTVIPASRSNVMPTATFQFLVPMGSPAASSSISLDRSAVTANSADCRLATVAPTCQDSHLFYTAFFNVLQGELERQSWRTYVDFDLTDNVKLFGDITYASGDGYAFFQPAFSNAAGGGTLPVFITGDNAFLNGPGALAASLRTQWTATGLALTNATRAQIGKFWGEFGGRDTQVFRESYRAITGIEGGFNLFGRDVSYDFYGQYSELDGFALAYNVPNISRVQQSVDAVNIGGEIVCRDATARANGCVAWDLINGPSPEAVAWANANARSDGLASQTVVATNFSTDLFELPAGALAVATGAEYRKEKSDQIQDQLSASGALFYNAIGRTRGEYDLSEAYVEIGVPLLKELPLIHNLRVELAGRTGDYSTVGGVDQWRVLGEWAPFRDLRFRASQAVSVRAPNITELFSPQGRNFTTAANDPCDRAQVAAIAANPAQQAIRIANCAAVIPGYSADPMTGFVSNFGTGRPSLPLLQGGNPDLGEEAADTFTVGMIVQPRWVEGLQLSTDYWKIEVDDAVNLIPINTLLTNLCYDVDQDPTSNRFCDLIVRDPTGALSGTVGGVSEVILTQQNVQSIETSGIDVALAYDHDFGNIGRFQFKTEATKVIRWDLQGVPGGPVTHFAGILTGPIPEYKVNAAVGWSFRNFSFQFQSRYQSSMGVSEVEPVTSRDPFYTGNYWEHDLRGSYRFTDNFVVRGGIINLTDEHPPFVPEAGNGTGTASSTYDNRGSWFYVGGNYTF